MVKFPLVFTRHIPRKDALDAPAWRPRLALGLALKTAMPARPANTFLRDAARFLFVCSSRFVVRRSGA